MADNVREFVVSSLNQFNTYLNENILSQYAGYSYVYDAYSYVLQAIEDNEYVTAYGFIQLNDKINNIGGGNLNIDLSTYVSKDELTSQSYVKSSTLNTYVTKNQLSNQSYVTTTVLSEQGYLTSHQDLSTYVSKIELNSLGYVTYAYAFNEYPSYTYLDEKLTNIDLSTYVSKTELSSQSYLTSHQDLSTYVSKTELEGQSYITQTQLDNASYITSHQDLSTYVSKTELEGQSYVTQTVLSNQSYAGYAYIYDSYAYIMTKINALELASGGGGSGTSAEGGITAISFNGTPASITGSVATIVAPINDPAIEITMNGETYSFTLNQSTAYSINLGTVLTSHQDLSTYVSKSELSSQSYLTSIPNTYATYAAIEAMCYVTQTQLDNAGYITSGLPSVSSSDNGKILMVVNGAWSLVLPSTIYSGNATPSNANGNNGDIYLQS